MFGAENPDGNMMRTLFLLSACLASTTTAFAAPAGPMGKGKELFATCSVCHNLAKGQPNKIGPNLNGLFGAKAGTRPAFAYSPALKAASVKWNDKSLDAFLAKPQAVVPGNRMPYAGMTDAGSRQALIAYLKEASH